MKAPVWWFVGLAVSMVALIASAPFIHAWSVAFLLPEMLCLYMMYRTTRQR
jgi:hypothetical protein